MDEFCKLAEVFLRGTLTTPEGEQAIQAFDNVMWGFQDKFAERVKSECYGGNGKRPALHVGRAGFAVLAAVVRAPYYSVAEGHLYQARHHPKRSVSCAFCDTVLNTSGKNISTKERTMFIALDGRKIGIYLCERCGKFLQLAHILYRFTEWTRRMLDNTTAKGTTTMQEVAGAAYAAPKSRTSAALKTPIQKWKAESQNYNETVTPFVKGVVTYRTALEYLIKFVEFQPGVSSGPKRRRTMSTAAAEGGGSVE
jgi:hypothetical protein